MECLLDAAAFHAGQYLTFRLAGQELAVDAERVRSILPMHEMAPVEESPFGLGFDALGFAALGVAELGTRHFPVIDLRARLGLSAPARGREPMIVVVELGSGELLGFVADRIAGLVHARAAHYRHGKLRMGGRPRRVIDVDSLKRSRASS